MIFSPQKWYCNCCGKEMFSPPCHAFIAGHNRGYKVCSVECSREMQWRDTLSIMGSEYYPQPRKNKALTEAVDAKEAEERGDSEAVQESVESASKPPAG